MKKNKICFAFSLALPFFLGGCHNIPRDINAEEIVSDFATPVFSHKLTVKKIVATSCPITNTHKKADE